MEECNSVPLFFVQTNMDVNLERMECQRKALLRVLRYALDNIIHRLH